MPAMHQSHNSKPGKGDTAGNSAAIDRTSGSVRMAVSTLYSMRVETVSEYLAINLHIHAILTELAKKRPIFHSEADLQHELAWQIHLTYRDAKIRIERPFGDQSHLDLSVQTDSQTFAIELKYCTALLDVEADGEQFQLKNQSANDIRRYTFLNDVQRLERLVESQTADQGFAVIITNDAGYWKDPVHNFEDTIDAAFRIHEGREVRGHRAWAPKASQGTKKGHEEPINLQGSYTIQWHDYSNLGEGVKNGQFRYCVVDVSPSELKK